MLSSNPFSTSSAAKDLREMPKERKNSFTDETPVFDKQQPMFTPVFENCKYTQAILVFPQSMKTKQQSMLSGGHFISVTVVEQHIYATVRVLANHLARLRFGWTKNFLAQTVILLVRSVPVRAFIPTFLISSK
jgi:hypothetical protein